jgi:peptidoglycan/xylan/chitin deacetylase (PgdA/CDA1 family)
MSLLTRAAIPVIALGVGTWLGMGRPDAQTLLAAGGGTDKIVSMITNSLRGATRQVVPERSAAPPLDRAPSTVDASALPDPPSPFPRLNPEGSAERAWLLAEGPVHAPCDSVRHDSARSPESGVERQHDSARSPESGVEHQTTCGRRLITFTFDDGPFPETAPTVLRILEQHRIRATFFFIGSYLEGDDKHAVETRMWARRIAEAGHFVGNHTFDHKLLTQLPHAAQLAEIDDSAEAIERATGKRPILFRPPYGEVDPWLEGTLRDRHLELLLWSIDVEDMKKSDPDLIVEELKKQLEYKGGGIVLLHDMHWPSVKAFNRLLRWVDGQKWDAAHPERAGWDIVDLAEYLRATAASPQPYATREDLERARKAQNAANGRR